MARKTASADSPPPPISPSPTSPVSVSTSTMVRTKRPQWQPLAWRSGASRGTVTVVARISRIFTLARFCFIVQQKIGAGGRGGGAGGRGAGERRSLRSGGAVLPLPPHALSLPKFPSQGGLF